MLEYGPCLHPCAPRQSMQDAHMSQVHTQILTERHVELFGLLGKQSGRDVDKLVRLAAWQNRLCCVPVVAGSCLGLLTAALTAGANRRRSRSLDLRWKSFVACLCWATAMERWS